ncbi:MAG: bifunctional phosphopantothenoylcysteine decarboxylase/phosphopantothenate--cysteine ligase CoaBC, partial [Dehalococcoidia bacterium]|nr:bifunctional phosphopantothenoylcysteine decarboxylase/phosphopantothenate--cysteine ligase CoaBC [Dehalococcoidia bacterium]
MLNKKNIVLGVTGGIAIYKAVELARKLALKGASVDVVMTKSATEFITPLTFRSVTHRPVVIKLFELTSEFSIEHVSLAKRADILVIAPATANIIAKLAAGIADDMLSCVALDTRAPILIAPAMETNMYQNQATQENIDKLKGRGCIVIDPSCGKLASGTEGIGRLANIEQIIDAIRETLGKKQDLAGKKIVVTAGGTQEPIDPVRYISNRSSGKMGYAIAEAARDRGADVTLISAPAAIPVPLGINMIPVRTALQMRDAVFQTTSTARVLIMAAAVADYRPAETNQSKVKSGDDSLILKLTPTEDIIGGVSENLIKIGFAAESDNLIANAQKKLKSKRLDMIVANDISATDAGFDVDSNRVVLIDKNGNIEHIPLMLKS